MKSLVLFLGIVLALAVNAEAMGGKTPSPTAIDLQAGWTVDPALLAGKCTPSKLRPSLRLGCGLRGSWAGVPYWAIKGSKWNGQDVKESQGKGCTPYVSVDMCSPSVVAATAHCADPGPSTSSVDINRTACEVAYKCPLAKEAAAAGRLVDSPGDYGVLYHFWPNDAEVLHFCSK